MRDIYQVMKEWGAWVASDKSNIDWQTTSAGFRKCSPPVIRQNKQCSDDDGLIIDRYVSILKNYNREEAEMIILHFVNGISLRRIAKMNKCSDGTIRKKIQVALAFINAAFYLNQ